MREITDPFKGKTYSQVLESLSKEDLKKYTEKPSPLLKVPGTGLAVWDATIGRHVV